MKIKLLQELWTLTMWYECNRDILSIIDNGFYNINISIQTPCYYIITLQCSLYGDKWVSLSHLVEINLKLKTITCALFEFFPEYSKAFPQLKMLNYLKLVKKKNTLI